MKRYLFSKKLIYFSQSRINGVAMVLTVVVALVVAASLPLPQFLCSHAVRCCSRLRLVEIWCRITYFVNICLGLLNTKFILM